MTFLIFYLLSWSLCFIVFILSLCWNKSTLESIFEYIRQKWRKKKILILKFRPGLKCLHIFFSSRDEISSLSFWQRWVHSGMKFHLGKNVWTARDIFTIDRDDFIPGWNFTWKHSLRVLSNYLYLKWKWIVESNRVISTCLKNLEMFNLRP